MSLSGLRALKNCKLKIKAMSSTPATFARLFFDRLPKKTRSASSSASLADTIRDCTARCDNGDAWVVCSSKKVLIQSDPVLAPQRIRDIRPSRSIQSEQESVTASPIQQRSGH